MKKQVIMAVLISMAIGAGLYLPNQHKASEIKTDGVYAGVTETMHTQLVSAATTDTTLVVETGESEEEWINGFTTTRCNLRKEPSTDADIVDTYDFNSIVCFCDYGDSEWVKVKYWGDIVYMSKEYISLEECKFRTISIPNYEGFKSWMSYTAITNTSSKQYELQQMAYIGSHGIRQIDGRYLIAIGTGAGCEIGDYVDLVLDNGTVINCIVSDIKANCDTESNNLITSVSQCCSEFIVDTGCLSQSAYESGNISDCEESWDAPVCEILAYEENVFND